MIGPSKWRHLKGLADIMALASCRRDDPRSYPTNHYLQQNRPESIRLGALGEDTAFKAGPLLQRYGMQGRDPPRHGIRLPGQDPRPHRPGDVYIAKTNL